MPAMTRLRFSEMTHADIPAVQSFLIKHLNLFFNAGRVMPAAEEDIFDLRQQYILQEIYYFAHGVKNKSSSLHLRYVNMMIVSLSYVGTIICLKRQKFVVATWMRATADRESEAGCLL